MKILSSFKKYILKNVEPIFAYTALMGSKTMTFIAWTQINIFNINLINKYNLSFYHSLCASETI